ncbi:MAG: hypothetical protein A4E36_00152 [Methanoregulaceae archaeon PtaB.Bin009]|nr:MAG: hypothetical protein A4E36_00152 [Methanoregulaceae archaeon PtaB.Bin009]OPY40336.1 MAG: hypothetical protein A4E41_01433 [Methanoregulaceae archaeon PtaU1.Bin066]
MKEIPKIMTGNSAKETCPKIVECIRHSSFIIRMKSSGMATLPDEREEEPGKVHSLLGQVCDGA